MRSSVITSLCLLALFTFGCESAAPAPETTPAPVAVDVAAETAAIKKIIIDQTKAFVARDVDKMVSYHTDPAQVIQNVYGQTDILSETLPHDVFKRMLQEYYDSVPKGVEGRDEETSDWNFRISDDGSMAWVTYKSTVGLGEAPFTNEEIRVLEKVDGVWKLALVSTLIGPPTTPS